MAQESKVADLLVAALLHAERVRRNYDLLAWVVKPNHVHVVLKPIKTLPEIMRWIKSATANRANQILGRAGKSFLQHNL